MSSVTSSATTPATSPNLNLNQALTDEIVTARQRGRSFGQIGSALGLSAKQVAEVYEQAIARQPKVSEAVYRQTQLNRLEALLDALHQAVFEHKDLDAIDRALRVIKEISETAELKRKQAETVINIVDQRQVEEVTVFVGDVAQALKRRLLASLAPANTNTGTNTTPSSPNLTPEVIDAHWDEWVAEAVEQPRARLAAAKETVSL